MPLKSYLNGKELKKIDFFEVSPDSQPFPTMKRFAEMIMPPRAKRVLHDQFLCPITHSLMINPVQASDGWTYEWKAISRWCEEHNTSPLDPSVFIDLSQLQPNRSLRDAIQRLVEAGEFDDDVCSEWTAATAEFESAPEMYREGRVAEAAELGHPQAMGELSMRYYRGVGVVQDIPMALKWAHKAALAGNGLGQFRLGYAYHVGEGKNRNWAEALKFYSMAYENGVAAASANICEMYRVGGYGLAKNTSSLVEWCGRSNTGPSLYLLAMCYYTGDGIAPNHSEARRNFKAAASDVLDAQFMLGKMLIRGEGGNANFVGGIKCIERAAKQGHAGASAIKEAVLAAARA